MKKWKVPFSYLGHQFADPAPTLAAIEKVVRRGDFTLGKEVGQFEERIARWIDPAGHGLAVGLNSGTDALKIALRLAGVGPGDEVITQANTFVATAGAIVEVGATPVLVDILPDLTMDPQKFYEAITVRTRAVIPVHFAGHVCDMKSILNICKEATIPEDRTIPEGFKKHAPWLGEGRNIAAIEDACQALGAARDGHAAGTFGMAAAFSLHPLKALNVWGDGGFIFFPGGGPGEYKNASRLRNHGLVDRDSIDRFGYNSRLDTIHAAVALRQVGKLRWAVGKRRKNAARYDERLFGWGHINLPGIQPTNEPSFHLYIVYAERRDELIKLLGSKGIEAKVHYPGPQLLAKGSPFYEDREKFPVTLRAARDTISLPIHQYLEADQIDYVCEQVREFYA